MPRETTGCSIKETGDVLGMRATRSDDTRLDGAFVPDRYIVRVLPMGFGGADLLVLAIVAWALLNFGSIYLGLAARARDLAVAAVKSKTAEALTRSMAHHPEIQHAAAEMTLGNEAMAPHIERIAEDWSTGATHGAEWPAQIVAARYHRVKGARRVVDLALDMSGGAGMFKRNELERLHRDVRCGGFHPANRALVRELVGKTVLGISPEEQPRWGEAAVSLRRCAAGAAAGGRVVAAPRRHALLLLPRGWRSG